MKKTTENILITIIEIVTGIITIAIFAAFIWFRAWQADYNFRCFTAQDPATCATIKNK